jgi:hypothetical protein
MNVLHWFKRLEPPYVCLYVKKYENQNSHC